MEVLSHIYHLILLLVVLKAFVTLKRVGFVGQNFLIIYLMVTFCIENYSWISYEIDKTTSNGLIYNIYAIFAIIFFWFYYQNIYKSKLKFLITGITVFSMCYIFFQTNYYEVEFDRNIGISKALFCISCALIWYGNKIRQPTVHKITNDPAFWISTAILFWACFYLFRIIPMHSMHEDDPVFLSFLRKILYAVNIVMYSLFYVALVKYENNVK